MKESYECEIAAHDGPESFGPARKGSAEALTGVRASRGIQPRKTIPPGCRRHKEKRKAPSGAPISRGTPESRAVRDPEHVRRHLAREPGDPKSAPGSSCPGTHREVQGHTPMMNGPGKSDSPEVPAKSPNKAGQPAAEGMEGNGLAKGNLQQQNASRTPSRNDA